MCKCTPNIRTPFCGKPGCEWPEQRSSNPRFPDPEKDLFSDAMDAAASVFHSVRHGILRNAERAGETTDGEVVVRRSIAAAFNAYVRELRLADEPDDLLADLREIEGELMCAGGVGHHCSRCDNSTYDLSQKVRRLIDRLSPVETAPEGRGVRDNPPPHALGSSEGADTHSRLSEPDAANVAKPHDDPTAHRVADLRAQSQPTDEPSDVYRQELENIANAKRFDRKRFDDDTSFADWAQSRARHALTKSASECGACDKPGEHCANVHGICSRHGGRAHETKGDRT